MTLAGNVDEHDDPSSSAIEDAEEEESQYESDDSVPEITATNGLSPDILEILQRFQNDGCFLEDQDGHDDSQITSNVVCATYTLQDSQVIAATCRRLQEKTEEAAKRHGSVLKQRVLLDLEAPQIEDRIHEKMQTLKLDRQTASSKVLAQILDEEGVVRINQVLASNLCDAMLAQINLDLSAAPDGVYGNVADHSDKKYDPSTGFGNVFERHQRYDMYLRPEGIHREALHALLDRQSTLGGLIHDGLLHGQAGTFHEFSSLISDAGSLCQPIHPDSPFAPLPPLWTVFVALQAVTADMGPTGFLTRTHTQSCHDQLQSVDQKDALLASCKYFRGTLNKGDAIVMDSRTMHFGGANESKTRRVLAYFTIRNPLHGCHDSDFPKCGSKFPDLNMTTVDFG